MCMCNVATLYAKIWCQLADCFYGYKKYSNIVLIEITGLQKISNLLISVFNKWKRKLVTVYLMGKISKFT